MRDIKFRAWDKHLKAWAIFELGWSFDKTKGHIVFHPMPCPEISEYLEIGQYTGLKDKNGVEIYESDIVQFTAFGRTVRGLVEWDVDDGLPGFVIVDSDGSGTIWSFLYDDLTAIGNIYETPELLELHT